jgi:hypothetical protein
MQLMRKPVSITKRYTWCNNAWQDSGKIGSSFDSICKILGAIIQFSNLDSVTHIHSRP